MEYVNECEQVFHDETRKVLLQIEICVLQRRKPDIFQISKVGG